ncbi:MAG: hypothetical protein AAGF23_04835 [Acidobacteriota bacterium]
MDSLTSNQEFAKKAMQTSVHETTIVRATAGGGAAACESSRRRLFRICAVAVAFFIGSLAPSTVRSQELGRPLSTLMTPGLESSTPVWSEDGSYVVFILDLDFDGERELYSAAADGSGSHLLTSRVDFNFSFLVTPDSQRVLFVEQAESGEGEDSSRLLSVPIVGGPGVDLSAALPEGRTVRSFTVTPDAQTVVFETQPTAVQVFATPTTGGALTPPRFRIRGHRSPALRLLPRRRQRAHGLYRQFHVPNSNRSLLGPPRRRPAVPAPRRPERD